VISDRLEIHVVLKDNVLVVIYKSFGIIIQMNIRHFCCVVNVNIILSLVISSGLEILVVLKDDVLVMIYSRGFWNVVVVRRPLMLIIT